MNRLPCSDFSASVTVTFNRDTSSVLNSQYFQFVNNVHLLLISSRQTSCVQNGMRVTIPSFSKSSKYVCAVLY